tara:strand:+ start:942 stop:1145 length:204 start_codon:yes stop_codon:yes gene_type:complete
LVLLQFFAHRIPHEEDTLAHHFGTERYKAYAESAPIGIPFIPTRIAFQGFKQGKATQGDGGGSGGRV